LAVFVKQVGQQAGYHPASLLRHPRMTIALLGLGWVAVEYFRVIMQHAPADIISPAEVVPLQLIMGLRWIRVRTVVHIGAGFS